MIVTHVFAHEAARAAAGASRPLVDRKRPLSARLAHWLEPRRRSLDRTDTGHSALVAGTGLHAPKETLAALFDHLIGASEERLR